MQDLSEVTSGVWLRASAALAATRLVAERELEAALPGVLVGVGVDFDGLV